MINLIHVSDSSKFRNEIYFVIIYEFFNFVKAMCKCRCTNIYNVLIYKKEEFLSVYVFMKNHKGLVIPIVRQLFREEIKLM